MDKPLVSIIIPVYNAAQFLTETINSALQQTWANTEVIIIDDGSADDSLMIAKGFESDTVKVFSQQNKGAAAARNKGLAEAKGDYIQFLDADDLISENKIASQMSILKDASGYLGLCGTAYFDDTENHLDKDPVRNWITTDYDDVIDFATMLYGDSSIGSNRGGMIQPNCWLTPRSVIDKAGLWNEDLSVDDDGEFFCRVILNSKGTKYSYDAVNYYRKHQASKNLSAQSTQKAYLSRFKALNLKYNELLAATNNAGLVNQLFATFYWELGVQAYPVFKSLSAASIKKATDMNYGGVKYKAGKISTQLSKILGWRTVRMLTYIRYKV
jgi:glycosyltransferase involved in cell wall biosynthesis